MPTCITRFDCIPLKTINETHTQVKKAEIHEFMFCNLELLYPCFALPLKFFAIWYHNTINNGFVNSKNSSIISKRCETSDMAMKNDTKQCVGLLSLD